MRRVLGAVAAGPLVVLAAAPSATAGPPHRLETDFTPVFFGRGG